MAEHLVEGIGVYTYCPDTQPSQRQFIETPPYDFYLMAFVQLMLYCLPTTHGNTSSDLEFASQPLPKTTPFFEVFINLNSFDAYGMYGYNQIFNRQIITVEPQNYNSYNNAFVQLLLYIIPPTHASISSDLEHASQPLPKLEPFYKTFVAQMDKSCSLEHRSTQRDILIPFKQFIDPPYQTYYAKEVILPNIIDPNST